MSITPSLINRLAATSDQREVQLKPSQYEEAVNRGVALRGRPLEAGGERGARRQHSKGRMTVWERIELLADETPMIL